MSKMGKIYKDFKTIKNQKKSERLYHAIKILSAYQYRRCNMVHFKVGSWNFWPTTGLFINDFSGEKGRGLRNFLPKIEEYKLIHINKIKEPQK